AALPPFDPAQIPELELKGAKPDGTVSWQSVKVLAKPEFTPEFVARGKAVFKKACAGCHGDGGKGDGPVPGKYNLTLAPADLTRPLASIKIRSTAYGTPPADE